MHIDLDLVVEGGEVRGAAADGRHTRPFAGWLGLIAALDAFVSDNQQAGGTTS
jgi:hypothetical protein